MMIMMLVMVLLCNSMTVFMLFHFKRFLFFPFTCNAYHFSSAPVNASHLHSGA